MRSARAIRVDDPLPVVISPREPVVPVSVEPIVPVDPVCPDIPPDPVDPVVPVVPAEPVAPVVPVVPVVPGEPDMPPEPVEPVAPVEPVEPVVPPVWLIAETLPAISRLASRILVVVKVFMIKISPVKLKNHQPRFRAMENCMRNYWLA